MFVLSSSTLNKGSYMSKFQLHEKEVRLLVMSAWDVIMTQPTETLGVEVWPHLLNMCCGFNYMTSKCADWAAHDVRLTLCTTCWALAWRHLKGIDWAFLHGVGLKVSKSSFLGTKGLVHQRIGTQWGLKDNVGNVMGSSSEKSACEIFHNAVNRWKFPVLKTDWLRETHPVSMPHD
jgi:hypothetical protein